MKIRVRRPGRYLALYARAYKGGKYATAYISCWHNESPQADLSALNADPPQTRHKPRRTKKDNGGFLRVTEDTFLVAKTAFWTNFSP